MIPPDVFSYIPPTHSQMLVGVPIPATLFGRDILLSPLTIHVAQTLNTKMRQSYLAQHRRLLENTPEDIKTEVLGDLVQKARTLSVEYGDGQIFMFTNVDVYCMTFAAYCAKSTPLVTEEWVREKCCPLNHVSPQAALLLREVQLAVVVPYPKQQSLPPKNEPELETFLEDPDAEAMVRVFRGLAERYGFSTEQVMNMTPFQTYSYLFMLPEEHRRLLELEAMSKKNTASGGDVPRPPAGTTQMTPEEYVRFKAQFDAQKAAKTQS